MARLGDDPPARPALPRLLDEVTCERPFDLDQLRHDLRQMACAAGADARPPQRRLEPRRPRVVKLRALGTEVAIDDLKRMSAPAVAAFAAKRWIDIFALSHQRERRFRERFGGRFDGSVKLDNYFLGWMAVTDRSSTYSNSQLAESLHLELCRRPERERELLQRAAPTIAALATGPCPVN